MTAVRLSLLACAALLASTVRAAVTEDFSSYKPGQSVVSGVTLGAATGGWTGGWRTSSSYTETTGSIKADKPVDTGNYLDVKIAPIPTPGNKSSAAISRPYASPAKAFKITFRFRPTTSDQLVRYFLFDNDARAAGTGSGSWQIETANGQWCVADGDGAGSYSGLIETGLPVAADATYTFTLLIDPVACTWSVTLTDGKTTRTQTNLKFRNNKASPERWVHFGAAELAVPATGVPLQYAVDSISIQP